jgi:hypothetical protein
METIESFSEYLKRIGAPNLLILGITIIVLWLIISGLLKGFRKKNQDKGPDKED